MTKTAMHVFITTRVLSRLSCAGARRDEALRELLRFSAPGLDDASIVGIVASTPEIPRRLYEKWAGMFADRLLETVPRPQVENLCRNTEESNAALLLLYSMFMESARMEKVMKEDLEELGKDSGKNAEMEMLAGFGVGKGADPTCH
jgi:hypothetical protein